MTHTFKIRYANVLVGSMVLLILLGMIATTIFIGTRQHWFRDPFTIRAVLPYRRSLGLTVGTGVRVMDAVAGEVSGIDYHTNGYITAELTLSSVFKYHITTNAVGIVRKEFGLFGNQQVVLEQPREGVLYADVECPEPMKIVADVDVVGLMMETVDTVAKDLPLMIGNIQTVVSNTAVLTAQLADPKLGLKPILAESAGTIRQARELMRKLAWGKGIVARALNDERFADSVTNLTVDVSAMLEESQALIARIRKMSHDIEPLLKTTDESLRQFGKLAEESRPLVKSLVQVSDKLPPVVEHTDAVLKELPPTVRSADEALRRLPGLMMEMNDLMEEINLLTRGLQHNWFLSGGVEDAREERAAERVKDGKALELFYP